MDNNVAIRDMLVPPITSPVALTKPVSRGTRLHRTTKLEIKKKDQKKLKREEHESQEIAQRVGDGGDKCRPL